MKKSGISLILLIAIMILLMGYTHSFAANYALEIIQPRAGLNTTNRFYKAYPALEYNVRVAVIGGAYPFTYSLTTAPSGMTINANTGEITWPNPTTINSPHSVSVSVTDQESSTTSVSWTITVTTSGFRFIDAVNGQTVANGGTGTISNPWKSIRDMYEGNDYASKTKNSYANEFLYFRNGTYLMDGFIEVTDGNRVAFVSHNKPLVWLAYPGETPVLDMSQAYAAFYSGQNNAYIDGFTIENMTFTYGIQIDSDAQNVTFRNNTFRNLPTSTGPNNQAAIRISRGNANSRGNYWSIQDNVFYNIRHAYGIIAYGVDRVLVEDSLFYDISDPEGQGAAHAIGPKRATSMWFIRHNNIYNVAGDGIWVAMYTEPALDIEISFNRSQAINALFINQSLEQNGGRVYVHRNTFEGNVIFGTVSATTGPFYAYNNVIVNNTAFTDHIECLSCSDLSRLIRINNLSGYPSNNIVDSNGNLTPAYLTYLGTHGYQIDATAPTVEITIPTKENTYSTTASSINLSGTATDTVGIVSVTWSNDRGGSGTAWSGSATGTVNWTVSNIPLQSGQNIITVTATDGDAKTGVDVLIVNPTISNSGNTGGSGGGDSTSSGSGCGIIRGSDGKGTGSGLKAIDIGIASLLLLMLFYKLRKLYKINFWIVFVFFVIDITIANNVEAATLEVGAGKAYSTIQAATNVANAGDTILVFPGTYNERISLPSGKTGTAGNKIIFKSQTSRAAFMNGFDTGNANYLRIEGFDISYNVGGWYGGGIWINNSSYVDIVDNYFHDIPGQAINPNWSSGVTHNNIYAANNKIYRVNQGIIARGNDWLVENNDIERLVGTYYDADYTRFFGENITFRNNYFHGTTWQEICPAGLTSFDSSLCSHTDGFQTFAVNPGEYFKNVIIEGNVIRDWYSQGIMLEGKAGTADNLIVRNNIFADAASWGIAAHGIANLQVLNNNFVNMLIHGVGFRAASDGTPTTGVVQNNIFYNGGTNYWKETTCTGCTLTGGYNIITIEKYPYYKESTDLIGVDPLFVNASGYDFHLQSGSQAKDKGIALTGFAADKDGIVRPQGSAWDIGAYEYCASGSCTGGSGNGGDTGDNTGSSGGDSGGGSSGGGGCGFVKDDNSKGQKAKGEGVTLMIMLIIALKIISVTLHQLKRRKAL